MFCLFCIIIDFEIFMKDENNVLEIIFFCISFNRFLVFRVFYIDILVCVLIKCLIYLMNIYWSGGGIEGSDCFNINYIRIKKINLVFG